MNIQLLTPQAARVLEHMRKTGSITNVEANAVHRVRSVSRRITEISRALEGSDYEIRREFKRDVTGQLYVRYFLVKSR